MELLLLILKDIMDKKIRDTFYQHREAQTRAAQIKYGVSRLVFYTNRKLFQPRGKNQFVRHRNKIRYCLSFLNLYNMDRKLAKAKAIFHSFLEATSSNRNMLHRHISFFRNINLIKESIQFKTVVTETRFILLEKYFEVEKGIMTKYYFDRSKK